VNTDTFAENMQGFLDPTVRPSKFSSTTKLPLPSSAGAFTTSSQSLVLAPPASKIAIHQGEMFQLTAYGPSSIEEGVELFQEDCQLSCRGAFSLEDFFVEEWTVPLIGLVIDVVIGAHSS
jgi:hypothetical protein